MVFKDRTLTLKLASFSLPDIYLPCLPLLWAPLRHICGCWLFYFIYFLSVLYLVFILFLELSFFAMACNSESVLNYLALISLTKAWAYNPNRDRTIERLT